MILPHRNTKLQWFCPTETATSYNRFAPTPEKISAGCGPGTC